jgi:hypothetical protein
MNTGALIFIIVLIFIFTLFSRIRTNNKKEDSEKDSDIDNIDNDDTVEMENVFFEEVNNGKPKRRFLKIDNQFDLMFIKSLFQSESIPYYTEFEKISGIRPGMYIGDLGNYNLLYILEEDYDDALEIIQEYIEKKKTSKTENGNKESLRNIAEVVFGNWRVPSASDTNGVEIIYKKE